MQGRIIAVGVLALTVLITQRAHADQAATMTGIAPAKPSTKKGSELGGNQKRTTKSTKSPREDLKAIMDGVKGINRRKK